MPCEMLFLFSFFLSSFWGFVLSCSPISASTTEVFEISPDSGPFSLDFLEENAVNMGVAVYLFSSYLDDIIQEQEQNPPPFFDGENFPPLSGFKYHRAATEIAS